MITRIEARHYRCFAELDVMPGGFNVLAGANGSGKTTLLDIPVLLGELLNQRLCSAAFMEAQRARPGPRAHTLRELVHQEKGDSFSFAIEAKLPERVVQLIGTAANGQQESRRASHLRYDLQLKVVNNVELAVAREHLLLIARSSNPSPQTTEADLAETQLVIRRENGPTWFLPETRSESMEFQIASEQLALGSLPFDRQLFPAATWFHDFIRQDTVLYKPDCDQLRKASPPGLPARLIGNACNLPWLALGLQQEAPQRYLDWVDHVRVALPQVVSIAAKTREEDHHAYLDVAYAGGYRVTSSGLSDGTLRVLALTLVPYLTAQPEILITEEPENGIHPRGIEAVLQSLSSCYDSQVWISTHSALVLAHSQLKNVLCTRLEADGSVQVVAGDKHPRLRDWRGGIDLGSLFAGGVLE